MTLSLLREREGRRNVSIEDSDGAMRGFRVDCVNVEAASGERCWSQGYEGSKGVSFGDGMAMMGWRWGAGMDAVIANDRDG
jgi:hypothetical protein